MRLLNTGSFGPNIAEMAGHILDNDANTCVTIDLDAYSADNEFLAVLLDREDYTTLDVGLYYY